MITFCLAQYVLFFKNKIIKITILRELPCILMFCTEEFATRMKG